MRTPPLTLSRPAVRFQGSLWSKVAAEQEATAEQVRQQRFDFEWQTHKETYRTELNQPGLTKPSLTRLQVLQLIGEGIAEGNPYPSSLWKLLVSDHNPGSGQQVENTLGFLRQEGYVGITSADDKRNKLTVSVTDIYVLGDKGKRALNEFVTR